MLALIHIDILVGLFAVAITTYLVKTTYYPDWGRLSRKSVFLKEATISGQLVPRLDKLVVGGDTLFILGGGVSLFNSRNGEYWKNALNVWAERGCKVKLIFTKGSEKEVHGFWKKIQNKSENLELYHIGNQFTFKKKYERRNLVVLVDSSRYAKALWAADNYEPELHISLNVNYTGPQDIVDEGPADEALRDANSMLSKSTFIIDDKSEIYMSDGLNKPRLLQTG